MKDIKIPSVKFWAYCILFIRAGIVLTIHMEECDDIYELTIEDCFKEMEDMVEGELK